MNLVRILLVSALAIYMTYFLLKTIINGFKTGKLRHTDDKKYYDKDKQPIRFWLTVILFISFIIIFILPVWYVIDDIYFR